MRLEVSRPIDRLGVFAEGHEQINVLGQRTQHDSPVHVATFEDPVLLTDTVEIAKLPSGLREAVFRLYGSPQRTTNYDGVEVTWDAVKYPTVWSPSIDTVFLARGIRRFLDRATHIAEVGTASGFLIKYAMTHAPDMEWATATDINPEAIDCATDNTTGHPREDSLEIVPVHQNSDSLNLDERYDLIISNPPYIPRPGEDHTNPYEGLDVVHKLSQEGQDLLLPEGRILMNVSSIAGDGFLEWFRENGFSVRHGEDSQSNMRVPLKVNPVTNGISDESIDWQAYLRANSFVEVDENEVSGYQYWHTLRLFEIFRTPVRPRRVRKS